MGKKILIADDSRVFRQMESQVLKGHGYELILAENGAEATRLAIEKLPDLVLLDIQMPLMDGVQVLSVLKKNPATAAIPVVIITTLGRDIDKKLMTDGGAAELLPKPIRAPDLLATIRRLIGE